MSASEYLEWQEYYSLEPFGEERADLRAGIIASTIYNVNRGKNRALKPEDFMPKFKTKKQSTKQLLKTVELLNVMFGGQDLRGKRNGVREINSSTNS